MTQMSFITINHGFSFGFSVRKPQLSPVLVQSMSTCQTSSVASVEYPIWFGCFSGVGQEFEKSVIQ